MGCKDYTECKGHNGIKLSHCGECSGCEHEYKLVTLNFRLGIDTPHEFKQCSKCGWSPIGV